MIIKSIKLSNFRNYKEMEINFDDGINILYGKNAQGKTNILESAYLCATTKSHKGSKDKEMIRFGSEEAHIRTVVEKKSKTFQIDLHLRSIGSKGVAINKMPIKRAVDLFGILNIVFFSPEDLNIIKNGPDERRRFMDMELCQLDKIYFHNLTEYKKALTQRNKLLKQIYNDPKLKDTLSLWDEPLIKYGKKVIETRRVFIKHISEILRDISNRITGGKENIILDYIPNTSEDSFALNLELSHERDLRNMTTCVGPHRDDISFLNDGIDLKKFGSQGQQRTCALALKLSEIELVKKITNDTPVLLLDDVLSELDRNRQNYLLDNIKDIQTMITCTGLEEFVNSNLTLNRIIRVITGTVEIEK